jgi:ferredoxin
MKFQVLIEDTGESYRCDERDSVLSGMENLGRKGIPVGCRNGGCGVCKVAVLGGDYAVRAMSREHVSVEDEAQRRVLACRVRPCSDLQIKVLGKMKKSVCRPFGPAAASETTTETNTWQ